MQICINCIQQHFVAAYVDRPLLYRNVAAINVVATSNGHLEILSRVTNQTVHHIFRIAVNHFGPAFVCQNDTAFLNVCCKDTVLLSLSKSFNNIFVSHTPTAL